MAATGEPYSVRFTGQLPFRIVKATGGQSLTLGELAAGQGLSLSKTAESSAELEQVGLLS